MPGSKVYESVTDFYAGKSVFITGGTGYLGKVYIEKILYTCRDIANIYMLIRDKKGVRAEERMQQILDEPIFSRLKAERPEDLKKLVPVLGDITFHNLGIQHEDLQTLLKKVSIVIHSAANLKFSEPLNVAMNINVEGTRNVLNVCHHMKNIQVFAYISTAYTNTDRPVIEEKLYDPPASLEEVYAYMEKYGHNEKMIKKLWSSCRPNTYTFTKCLAENYVAANHGNIPTIIIKPSIVTPTKNEPLVGWLGNRYGATTMLTMFAQGLSRVIVGRGTVLADLIPVDYVCNLTLIALAKGCSSNNVNIYNSCTSSCNPITLSELVNLYVDEAKKHDFPVLPYPKVTYIPYKWIVVCINMLFTIIALVVDLFRRMLGKNAVCRKMLSFVFYVQDTVEHFLSNHWIIKCERSRALYQSLSATDKDKFRCDCSDIHWEEYIRDYVRGVHKYLMEPMKKQKNASKRNE